MVLHRRLLKVSQRDPAVVLWPSGFLRPGKPNHKNYTVFKEDWLFGLAALGGNAKNKYVLEHVWFLGLGTPFLPKNTWPKQHFGIPLNERPNLNLHPRGRGRG